MEQINDMPIADAKTAVFFDEADEVLTNIITFDPQNNLNGIYYCKDAYSTFYFSATMPDPVLKMLKGCMGGIETLAFPSQYQISTKDNQHCKITGYLFSDEKTLIDQFCSDIANDQIDKPLIIFVEESRPEVISSIQRAIIKKFKVQAPVCNNYEALKQIQPVIATRSQGAIILSASLYRGLNISW